MVRAQQLCPQGGGSRDLGANITRAIGAVAVTIPSCWYLLSNAPDNSHGHDDHGAAHSESHGKEDHHEESKEEPEEPEESAEKSEAKDSEKDEESGSEDEGKDVCQFPFSSKINFPQVLIGLFIDS